MAAPLEAPLARHVLAQLLPVLDEGVHVVDPTGVTVYYNDAAGRLDGLDPSEVIGRPLLAVFPSLTEETSTLLRVLRSRQPIVSQTQTFTNFKGRHITTVNSTWPIVIEGRLAGALELSKDVTQVRALSERIVDLEAALRHPPRRSRSASRSKPADGGFGPLVGRDPAFREALDRAGRVARTASPVLVYGETGTGKELLCHAIHQSGPRRQRPLIAQNCAALPDTLLEAILFGTARGSYTGAEERPGLLELADGGTLLLDEINSMSADLQAKLLRVLEDGRVRRLGAASEREVDVRILAVANEDPWLAVTAGRLRQDLYYRLNVVSIRLPPLRERPADIPLLAESFLTKHAPRVNPAVRGFGNGVLEAFQRYAWPGNVRELEHAVEGALHLADGERIELDHLDARIRAASPPPPASPRPADGLPASAAAPAPESPSALARSPVEATPSVAEAESPASQKPPAPRGPGAPPPLDTIRREFDVAERDAIVAALARANGNVAAAARLLGLPRQTLQYRMKRLELGP